MLDVVIVGGGISGLYAAYLLQKKGLNVQVIEAASRLGGRLHTTYTPEGHPIDLGGQWIGPQHTRLLNWINAYKIPVHRTYTDGANLLITNRKRRRYHGTIPKLSWAALLDLGWGLAKLKKMAQNVSPIRPWEIYQPAWDEITLAEWMRRTFTTTQAYEAFAIGLSTVLGCEPAEVSLWHALFYIRSAGSLEALIEAEGGAQELKFSYGAATLIESIAQQVPWITHERVYSILWQADKVSLRTTNKTYNARTALFAIPPAAMKTIEFSPPLPPVYAQLPQRMPMGTVTKVIAIFDRPFWREEGLSGHVLRLEGALRVTFDTSPEDGSYGQITGFGVGKVARGLLHRSPEERQAYYAGEIRQIFGRNPRWLYHKTWADDPLIGGCYAGFFPPGGWGYFGESLRQPIPPLYWCGTERAVTWMGYIEGAMAAAETAVKLLTEA
ncbi:MAG: FAD-dependent oxidoreductase [Bacteroidia bacterium]|nr:FAD-dependent oxidoreductase [Bacteroidia bacterium]MCX7651565.1 FAD-dependent oxidoreductase [Bacteroidia bacterium]MDW8417259.1 NAD(P)/FAD-dependent oxidoreductase [Bacteroidia bacterium]